MNLLRDNENGTWSASTEDEGEGNEKDKTHAAYVEALPRYLNLFDQIFVGAKARWEFWFLWTLLGIRGAQDPGWDPYETSLDAIKQATDLHRVAPSYEGARHLQLWIYGHVVEASEPYEILANLVDISQGGMFHIARFPPKRNGWPQSPGEKIEQLARAADAAGRPNAVIPLREVWDRDLRNAIFHSDYSLYDGDVRIQRNTTPFPTVKKYTHNEVLTLVNRALAYFEALKVLRHFYISSYTEPKVIPVDPRSTPPPNEHAVVMVREGHGAIGLKHAWTAAQLTAGLIPWSAARFFQDESAMAQADPTRALFPARKAGIG